MYKLRTVILSLLLVALFSSLFTSCNSTSEITTSDTELQKPEPSTSYQPYMTINPIEEYERELDDVWIAVIGIFADSDKWTLDQAYTGINNLDSVTAGNGAFIAADYFPGTTVDGEFHTGCVYDITKDGDIIQVRPDSSTSLKMWGTRAPLITSISNDEDNLEDQEIEWHNIKTAVLAGMADGVVKTVSGAGEEVFGNTGHATSPPYTGTDCLITDGIYVGDYIWGGTADIAGAYTIEADGTVVQVWFP